MRNLFAYIGKRLINATTPKKLLAVLRRARERGTLSVAHEALRHIGRIFRYAVIAGRAEHGPQPKDGARQGPTAVLAILPVPAGRDISMFRAGALS